MSLTINRLSGIELRAGTFFEEFARFPGLRLSVPGQKFGHTFSLAAGAASVYLSIYVVVAIRKTVSHFCATR